MTPQLALRVAIIGSFALAMFAIIFFRLWFLQVLSGQKYLNAASVNLVRDISIPAPRGDIVDSTGHVLVENTTARDVVITPSDLPVPLEGTDLLHPPRADAVIYVRLANVLGMPTARQPCKVPGVGKTRLSQIGCAVAQEEALLPYANATVQKNVGQDVQYYLAERQNLFPGVSVEQVYVRNYPLGDLAAQLFGTVGPINPQEVKERKYRGLGENAIIGQSGLEASYDRYLRGVDGEDRIEVDALGNFKGYLNQVNPMSGHVLKLSLNVPLQQAGEQALEQSIQSNYPANGGAFVAMNPENGELYAMGSNPTFDPSIFTKTLSEATYQQLTNPSNGDPLLNRAIQSAGPTGSTFKPITATAALESGVWNVDDTYDDTGQFCVYGQCRRNAGGAANGVLDLVNAIRVSDDVFFYNLGDLLNADPTSHPNGGALQQWARKFGIGQNTGIDLPDSATGNLPDPRWRDKVNREEAECDNATGPFKGHPKHPPGGCGIADGTNRPWTVGDNINLAVGQGDVQVSPLQLAVAYSALANGGTVVTPHLGLDIETPDGTVLQKINPPPGRNIHIDPGDLGAITEGMHEAAQAPGGTSDDVFGNFPLPVYGKTGTAQYNGQQDYAWYACFVPATATSKPITVVVWVEQGGFGAVAAAPVAREMLSQWFFGKRGQFVAGTSRTL
jgi:penicillin-binding protein 2